MTNAQPQPSTATVALNHGEGHCEKYRQFMDSSVQERTFMIEKLVGKKQQADLQETAGC